MKRSLPLVLILALIALLMPFSQRAEANHGSRDLNVEPETNSRPTGQTQTITATLTAPADQASGAINIDFELEAGQNDTDGDSPQFPDRTCSIPAGQSSCSVSYVGKLPGTDTWRVWVDHDGLNSTTEADPNETQEESPQDEGNPGTGDLCNQTAGLPNPSEPDCTDVVEYTWQGVVFPGQIDCDDEKGPDTENAFNPSGGGDASNESVTCKVFDENGNPITDADPNTTAREATEMYGENEGGVNDPDDGASYDTPDYTCKTPTNSASNQCTMTVTQSELAEGLAEVCFWAIGEGEGSAGNAGQKHCVTEGEPTGENQQSDGADTPNDLGDQIDIVWAERRANAVDVEPDSETLTVGEDRVLTATVFDQFGDEFQGDTQVDFEFFKDSPTDITKHDSDGNAPAEPDRTCTTANDPTCSITYSSDRAGRDLICAFLGDAPAMERSANDGAGKCNGEGLGADGKPEGDTDRVDVVDTTWLNEEPATFLDCEPETSKGLVRSKLTVTCTTSGGDPAEPVGFTEVDVEFTGANDPDNGNSTKTPDRHCTTNAEGQCTFSHGGAKAREAGVTLYRAFIDTDYDNDESEAEMDEGRNEEKTPGTTAEPDGTDVVKRKWQAGKRNVSLQIEDRTVSRGEKITFSGDITSAFDECKVDKRVKVFARKPGNDFKQIRKTNTDSDGNYEINRPFRVWKDMDFKAVVPQGGPCEGDESDVKRVNVKD